MHILLNGDAHELPAPLSVLALLERLAIDPRTVAVEHNRRVVKRARYADTVIDEGAEVEIVAFVGGGAPARRRWTGAAAIVLLSAAMLSPRSLAGQTAAPQAGAAAGVQSSEEITALARGWTLLAQGDLQGAAVLAQTTLGNFPRSVAALVLAVEVETTRGGAMAGLALYERWLGDRRVEDGYVLRRVAGAYLQEVVRAGDLLTLSDAQRALARDGDPEALRELNARAAQGSLKDREHLAAIGSEPSIRSLIRQLEATPVPAVQMRIIEAFLESRSPLAVPALIGLVSDRNEVVRLSAIDALGKIGAKEAIGPLKPLLAQPKAAFITAMALYRLGDFSGNNLLMEKLNDPDPLMPSVHLDILSSMSGQADQAWQARVRGLIQNARPEIRLGAAQLIAPYDPELAKNTVTQLFSDTNPVIREMAGRTMAKQLAGDFATLRGLLRRAETATRIHAADRILELTR